MNMIKVSLNIASSQRKLLVDLNPHQQLTVHDFLGRIVQVCELEHVGASDLELYDGEFLLPARLPSCCIGGDKMYRVVEKERDEEKGKIRKKKAQEEVGVKNKDKKEEKKDKKKRKEIKMSSSDESSSSQLQSFKQKPKKKGEKPQQSTQKPSKQVSTKQKPIQKLIRQPVQSSSQQQSTPHNTNTKKAAVNNQNNNKPAHNLRSLTRPISDSSSSESEEEEKPEQFKQKVNEILTHVNSKTKNQKDNELLRRALDAKAKQIVIAPASQIHHPKTTNERHEKPGESKKPLNIPISVRKKLQKTVITQKDPNPPKPPSSHASSFKQYKQLKWVPITKQILTAWKTHSTNADKDKDAECIAQVKNQIRFKIMELDEEKFVPVNSGWICGFVSANKKDDKDDLVGLTNATKEGRSPGEEVQFFNQYEIPFHNMQELQINKNTLTEAQKLICLPKPATQPAVEESQQKPKLQHPQPQAQKPQQSLQQYICGQIHYYFGQKNYSTDLFMQMHANRDPEKYINIKLMLNFPKIKKVLTDENILWKYLTNDDKYGIRNYQLDFGRKMIRKKD